MTIVQFDDIFPHIGGFGRYQFVLLAAASFVNILLGLCYYGQIFLVITPPHWCSSDVSLSDLNEQGYNLTTEQLRNWTIPRLEATEEYDKCFRYDINITQILESEQEYPNPEWPVTRCDHGWTYDFQEHFYPTITTELNLVCERDWIPPLTQSIFFCGSFFGGPIFGWLADYFGRIPIAVAANVIAGSFGIWSSLVGGYVTFCIARFFIGFTTDNNCLLIFILAIEYVSADYRTIVGNIPIIIGLSGIMLVLPWMAAGIANWRTLALVMAIPHFIVVTFPWILPESARWLIENGKTKMAHDTIHKVAKANGKVLTDEFEKDLKAYIDKGQQRSEEKAVNLLDLIKTPRLRKRFLLLIFMWVTMLIAYDGNVRNSTEIGGSYFVTFTLIGLMEAPGDLVVMWTMEKFGRRYTSVFSMVIAGICMIVPAFLPAGKYFAVALTFSLLNRLFITMSVNCGQQYAMEVLPTVGRAQGSGLIHTLGLGSIFVTPYIVYMNRFGQWIPFVILGIVAIVGGLSVALLPETLGEKLPDSLDDGENFFADQPFWDKPWKRIKKNTGENNEAYQEDIEIHM